MANADMAAGGLSGAASGAMLGAQVGSIFPGAGTIVGGVIGAIGGAIGGGILGKKKKYKEPARASGAVYGYDTYGNLVNKGTYAYNPSTGKYELRAGELSGAEKAMRQNLAGNIASLINTVGTTPDAFVRYAKELSDSYYKQGERKLTEQYEKAQTRLDESLARRGLGTSRAAADITGELQKKRFDTLADIYDASQRYGYNVQSGLQSQANQAMNTLAGYQGQLSNIDQSYLSKALQAQQLGQAYENAKAGVANQNIAMDNASSQNLLGGLSQLGSLAGYGLANGTTLGSIFGQIGGGSNGAQALASLGNTNYLTGYSNPLNMSYTPSISAANNVGGTSTGFLSTVYGNPGLGWV